jgi:hypothetical protein
MADFLTPGSGNDAEWLAAWATLGALLAAMAAGYIARCHT